MHALLTTLRQMTLPTEAARVFHGRGGLHPGCEAWTLDWYDPVWLLTSFAPASEADLAAIGAALAARWAELAPGQPLNWVFQQRDEMRADNRLMAGQIPEPHVVMLNGARFGVHLLRGQNHGLFLDMAEGHRWVREWAAAHPGARVLNLFAYTGAFSVAALRGGAARVDNYDMARGALAIAKRNHLLNGLDQGAAFLPHDIFNSWGRITRHGPYDLVVMDPPSHQKGSFVADKDWARLLRRLPELLAPGGEALLCLNSPKLGEEVLRQTLAEAAPTMEVVARLPNPAAFADVDPQRALKVLQVRRAAA
ncbi:class I SAM-dependent methyltransferase [Ideonella sp. 4Y16]|uniref:Class I SAM-dependent methyltransferase n=1 Tax=Ideonella alba TaxID=2824118 RepID=A0A940YLX8_9BURK|nr:class I SAM-dependent methyltransferase [Ideonella alba]MBQ0932204.1 class I SAM-dependent methyltransferase [Ideonella alba]MBQ0943709.1 class I SAM-dependent methyltransferase [Ideonella alba]